jgi:hypothetical protein
MPHWFGFGFFCGLWLQGIGFRVGKAFTFFRFKFATYEVLNLAKVLLLIVRDKRDCIAQSGGPSGTANAMDVVFGKSWYIIINHMRDPLNIDPARGDIGCDHHLELASFKAFHCLQALSLRATGVNRYRYNTGPL